MGTLGKNFPYTTLFRSSHVRLGQFLKEEFIPQAARGLASAFFFAAQDGEVHVRVLKQLDDGRAHSLCSPIIRPGAANPVEDLEVRVFFGCGHTKALGPRSEEHTSELQSRGLISY